MQLRVFRSLDGAPIGGSNVVPASNVRWSLALNEAGAMDLTIPNSELFSKWSARSKLRPWYACAALFDGDRIIHAGPVLRRKWTIGRGLGVSIGGGWDFFSKRLVLNHALHDAWVDGEVLLDEDNPSPQWVLEYRNLSLGGIGAGLVREALAWGELAVDVPSLPLEAGLNDRTYNGWDFAKTSARLEELTKVINGPNIRFAPYLREDGHLRFRYVSDYGGGAYHRLSTGMSGHGVTVDDVDEDGESLATDVFALGGRSDDIVLAARAVSTTLTNDGWPVMQEALKSHTSVSRLGTLKGHVEQRVVDGSIVPESTQLRARRSHGIKPGDVIDLTTSNSYHGNVEQILNVVSVTGDFGEWVTVDAFPDEV